MCLRIKYSNGGCSGLEPDILLHLLSVQLFKPYSRKSIQFSNIIVRYSRIVKTDAMIVRAAFLLLDKAYCRCYDYLCDRIKTRPGSCGKHPLPVSGGNDKKVVLS